MSGLRQNPISNSDTGFLHRGVIANTLTCKKIFEPLPYGLFMLA